MPDTSGLFPHPYPNASEVPDGPGAFQLLAQRATDSWARISIPFRFANFADRSAQAGQRVGDRAFQADTGAWFQWNGSAWVPEYEELGTAITPNAGYTITGQTMRREGRVVHVAFQATKSTGWASFDTIGTLNPAALRPASRNAMGGANNSSSGQPLACLVSTAGAVIFTGGSGIAGTNTLVGSVTYVIP